MALAIQTSKERISTARYAAVEDDGGSGECDLFQREQPYLIQDWVQIRANFCRSQAGAHAHKAVSVRRSRERNSKIELRDTVGAIFEVTFKLGGNEGIHFAIEVA